MDGQLWLCEWSLCIVNLCASRDYWVICVIAPSTLIRHHFCTELMFVQWKFTLLPLATNFILFFHCSCLWSTNSLGSIYETLFVLMVNKFSGIYLRGFVGWCTLTLLSINNHFTLKNSLKNVKKKVMIKIRWV